MATSPAVASVPEKPHQPTNLTFPKRSFGQKGVLCCFQSSWLITQWPFLHYDEAQLLPIYISTVPVKVIQS